MGYRFVRDLLTEQFGSDSLRELHRAVASGEVEQNLDDELRQMEALFFGAYVTVSRQLGLEEEQDVAAGSGAGAEDDAQTFLHWTASMNRDPDLSADARMMVPLFTDPSTKRTKVWVFLGWTRQLVHVSFKQTPNVSVQDKSGQHIDAGRLDVYYGGASYPIATPVIRELYVSKLLNREEFRRHCDAYISTAAILKNLDP
jgi:hypothetical protein